jgi:hypothetical protein
MKSINDSQTGENQLCRLEEQLSVYRNQKWPMQRNWQRMTHKTKTNKIKTYLIH